MNRKLLLIAILLLGAMHPLAAQRNYAPITSHPRVSILGDSYSTFEGHIPEGNAVWYWAHPDTTRTDVRSVRETWWWQVISEGGFVLERNDSYSGATVSYRGYRGEDYTDRSFITRLPRLGSPDVLLIFGGTNDSWAGVKVGNEGDTDLFTYAPALDRLLREAQDRYPGTAVFFILNDGLRDDITRTTRDLCRKNAVPCIELHDIDKKSGHPSVTGMKAIAQQVLSYLTKQP